MCSESPDTGPFDESLEQRAERLAAEFEKAWRAGRQPSIEAFLGAASGPERTVVMRKLLIVEIRLRREAGEKPSFEEYERRFPGDIRLVRAALFASGSLPFERIGHYKVVRWLGSGGFGAVFHCWDDRAERDVAVKVPHRDRFSSTEATQAILHEGRRVSKLRHAGVVTLYEVGEEADLCFLVYDFIEGMSLEELLRRGPIRHDAGASMIALIADALNYAHSKQLFHRDIKPANILLDSQGLPLITDFGMAVREEDLRHERGRMSGTYPYMSPEQVRGEGHRIDGRTDVYSLGVVLYQVLCECRPFRGPEADVLDQILHREPPPPRQVNPAVPPELERICLKAMAKHMNARYLTAGDMAEDLRLAVSALRSGPLREPVNAVHDFQEPETVATPSSQLTVSVVPKGLRSFGPEDSDFFLELLPGPRDRQRLPDSIRFWKARIESRDPDSSFAVGLTYGPSGCGKSSLIKAGLLPRLESRVIPVYVEATHENTKARLMKALQKICPSLAGERGLAPMITTLRRGGGFPGGSKVLVVIDQFEQWLHLHGRDMEKTQLVAALRQADGVHVQVLLMVRDDFWMSISRLFECLEINLDFAKNARAVDLFDASHARRVLRLFGKAYDRLPEDSKELTKDQNSFLDGAVAGLTQDGRVIPVRLSLFADLMKDWPWTSAGFKLVGGPEGVGVRFLEQTFTGPSALPDLRALEKPARALLQALLPESGSEIKGRMRSQQDLATASGLGAQPTRFARLLEILDRELHIITPKDAEEDASTNQALRSDNEALASFEKRFQKALQGGAKPDQPASDSPAPALATYYQLTHDYLVPSLRSWLTEERRKSWRGRAELCLEERTAQWSRASDRRFLPSAREFLAISLGVPTRRRNATQRALMKAAGRYYAVRGSAVAALLLLLTFLPLYAWAVRSTSRQGAAEAASNELFNARAEEVPNVLESLKQHVELALPILDQQLQNPFTKPSKRLRAAFGLAALGSVDQDFLVNAIRNVPSEECGNIVAALKPVKEQVVDKLNSLALDKQEGARTRYAIVLLHLGDTGAAKTILALAPDPTERTNFIHDFKNWHGDLRPIARILRGSEDPPLRSGLCSALGMIDISGDDAKEEVQQVVAELFSKAPDGGTHGAAEYALLKWGQALPPPTPPENSDWFVNGQGMTMVKIQTGEHAIYACDRRVTVKQFQAFMHDPNAEKPDWPGHKRNVSRTVECPVQNVSWIDALLFCNWLSDTERKKRCYKRLGTITRGKVLSETGKVEDVECDDWCLQPRANGYRLPTVTESLTACCSGTTTKYSFGNDASKLQFYAVFRAQHTSPDGRLIPNAWGLFGMHGNVAEWCWLRGGEPPNGLTKSLRRALRGGNYLSSEDICISASLVKAESPHKRMGIWGFRVVCDVPGVPAR